MRLDTARRRQLNQEMQLCRLEDLFLREKAKQELTDEDIAERLGMEDDLVEITTAFDDPEEEDEYIQLRLIIDILGVLGHELLALPWHNQQDDPGDVVEEEEQTQEQGEPNEG